MLLKYRNVVHILGDRGLVKSGRVLRGGSVGWLLSKSEPHFGQYGFPWQEMTFSEDLILLTPTKA